MAKKVDPLCMREYLHPFVEINGLFLPCCYLTTHSEHEKELRNFFGDENYEMLKLQNNHPKKIMRLWDRIANSWNSKNPYIGCARHCPKGGAIKVKDKD